MKVKTTLVFDKDARKEYLTGFHKRKQQRREKAKEEKNRVLKEEHKRIKTAYREEIKSQLPRIEDIFPEEVLKDTLKIINTKSHITEIEDINLNTTGLEVGQMNISDYIKDHNKQNNITSILSLKKALQMKCTKKTQMKRIKNAKKKIVKVKK